MEGCTIIAPHIPPIRALLLLGPTGSGKSPQGDLLEQAGPYHHFDFGAQLRAAVTDTSSVPSDADRAFIADLLRTHALLPDVRFDIATKLLDGFLARVGFDAARDTLVLNGLPRRVSQAWAIAEHGIDVQRVIYLKCGAATARARIARRRRGEGLDHAGRADDSDAAVRRKLAIFTQDTSPLLSHYTAKPGGIVAGLTVTADTDDEEMHRRLVALLSR